MNYFNIKCIPLSVCLLSYRIYSLSVSGIVTRQFLNTEKKNISNPEKCPHRFTEKPWLEKIMKERS